MPERCDIAEQAVLAIDLDKLKAAVHGFLYRSDTFTEESALRMLRATLAIEAKRAAHSDEGDSLCC